MQLLQRLEDFARWLRPARPVLVGLGLLALLLAAYLVLFGDPQTSDPVLLPAIIGLLWCLCAAVFITTFESVPPPADGPMGGWASFKRSVARLWYGLLALAFLGITIAAVSLTGRLMGEMLG